MSTCSDKQLRIFSPVILFHDYEFVKDDSGDLEHIHISYGDPHYVPSIETHKRRIHEMLEHNGRFWADIMTSSKDHPASPVPSLVSSPTPPLQPRDLPSPRKSSSPPPRTARLRSKPSETSAGRNNNNLKARKRRGNLPKAVTAILRDWLAKHKKHPYPTEEEKIALARQTNLTLNQISNWFINARRRILQPMLDEEEEENGQVLDILPYDGNSGNDTRTTALHLRSSSPQQMINAT
ncbi:hypothetical protein DFQ28_002242 [Apophysomyces sp. BC1034]|nr:hypothetical protein DFQ30_002810 [Apophysomyces sp. BC1015]KAG0179753.1 hypothetical protein DFQ29_001696 [Apophysomyces sp. BC1021]KAG0190292.1 hypothetical protein DFQ28_002242 [Apophysomyces sp. BC1034]